MAEYRGIEATIGENELRSDIIDVWELTKFLRMFRATYVAAYERVTEPIEGREVSLIRPSAYYLRPDFIYHVHDAVEVLLPLLRMVRPMTCGQMAERELPVGVDINITSISFQSPLKIAFEALPIALGVAVIISGGELKLGPFLHVKLPPLGTGISMLREAFGQRNIRPRQRKK